MFHGKIGSVKSSIKKIRRRFEMKTLSFCFNILNVCYVFILFLSISKVSIAQELSEQLICNVNLKSFVDGSSTVSSDNKHFAYIEKSGNKQRVVLDGKRGKLYSSIFKETLTFTDKSNHLIYLAREGNKFVMIIDGIEGEPYDDIPSFTIHNGDHITYAAKKGDYWFAVKDNIEGKPYNEIGEIELSLDGKHIAYEAKKGDNWLVVRDGIEGKYYHIGNGSIKFSKDGMHLAYVVLEDGVFVVLDGIAGKRYDSIIKGSLKFNPVSNSLVYLARIRDKYTIVLDSIETRFFDFVSKPFFTPDGKHLAYWVKENEKCFLIYDNKKILKEYDGYGNDLPKFSADSQHMLNVVLIGDMWTIIFDSTEGKKYNSVGEITISPDGKSFAYYGILGNKKYIVLNHQEIDQIEKLESKLTFSPDSKHLAYAVRDGKKEYVVLDGRYGKKYDDVTLLTFSPDSKHLVYRAMKGEKQFIVVDGKESKKYEVILYNSGRGIIFTSVNTFSYVAFPGNKVLLVTEHIKNSSDSSHY